jgi:hypothetical protein
MLDPWFTKILPDFEHISVPRWRGWDNRKSQSDIQEDETACPLVKGKVSSVWGARNMICRSCQGDGALHTLLDCQTQHGWRRMDGVYGPTNQPSQSWMQRSRAGTNRVLWLIMHPYQPEKKCIDAMLARSPNLPFVLSSFLSRLQSADCRQCESGQWWSEQGPAFIQMPCHQTN